MDREGSMPHSALNRTAWIKALSLSLIYLVNVFYKSVLGVVGAWDAIAAKDRPQEKDVYVKYEITMSIEMVHCALYSSSIMRSMYGLVGLVWVSGTLKYIHT